MNRFFKYIIFSFLALNSATGQEAADTLDILNYVEKNEYEIGSIAVAGAPDRDRNAIKSIAGLKEGNKIKIPGLEITKAVKALMKLRLFDDVQIIQNKVDGDIVHITIVLVERPTLARYSYKGVKKSEHDDLNEIVKNILNKGGIVTDAAKNLAMRKIEKHYQDKGKLDAKVKIKEIADEQKANSIRLVFDIKPGEKVKVGNIVHVGNKEASGRKLRKKMKNTKKKGTLFKKSKYIAEDYEEDKESIIAYYNSLGFRDARVKSDSIWRDAEGQIQIQMNIHEGNRYYFRDISWKGNSLYTDEQSMVEMYHLYTWMTGTYSSTSSRRRSP